MNINKKLATIALTGVMSIASITGAYNAVGEVTIVSAKEVTSVEDKVNHLIYSLKNNYLGLKNIGQWQQYIKETRTIVIYVKDDAIKKQYSIKINKAEELVNAAAKVNQLEKSIEVNSHTMQNVSQWQEYIEVSKNELSKVDLGIFRKEYNNLIDRIVNCYDTITEIKNNYNASYKAVKKIYKEALELEKTDKQSALNKAREAKEAAQKLQSYFSKDEILKDIDSLIDRILDVENSIDK